MSESNPGNTMEERVGNRRSRLRLYVLMTMNRTLLAGILAIVMFGVFVGLGAYAVPAFRTYMTQSVPTRYTFQAFITALITGVTLVVTINQLVLSQELGPLPDQRERMSGSMSFRGDVEDIFGTASPPEPAAFLRALVDNTTEKAETLRETVSGNSNDNLVTNTNQFVDNISDNAEVVSENLEDEDFGSYSVVKAALDYNYSWKIYQAHRLRDIFGEDMSDDEQRALIELIDRKSVV